MVDASAHCAHCRLPLPIHPHCESTAAGELLFCCVGCVIVFRVIGSAGEGGRADWYLAKLGLATLLSGNVMMFQALFYFWSPDDLGPEILRNGSWIMLACSLAVYALLGVPMLRIAGRAALRGRLSLETLIGLGALAAIGFSAVDTLRGGRQFYYDSGTMVLVFVSLGQYLDAESRRKAMAALSPAIERARRTARVLRGKIMHSLTPEQVQAGEHVEVRGGEEIPVDGVVIEGTADVHEPMLSGEWRPRLVKPGDFVSAGATASDGALTIQASGGVETLAERVERWAHEARLRKAPIEALVDRVVSLFIPAVAIVALLSLLIWGLKGSWSTGGLAALSVLVVACPCALGIATPLATTIALWRASTRGNLIRSGAALEALSTIRRVAFDKTGTLTQGRPQVREFIAAAGSNFPHGDTLHYAAAIEARASHPFARAIVDYARTHSNLAPDDGLQATTTLAAVDVRITPGGGIAGQVNGHTVLAGSRCWLAQQGVAGVPAPASATGDSSVMVAIDRVYQAEFVLEDALRDEACATVTELRALDVSCHVLSGDQTHVVAALAHQLGCISFEAALSPAEKPVKVLALRQSPALTQRRFACHGSGGVAMVGDGVNDAPALAAATVGIAFGAAADLARNNADVVVLREDLHEIPRLLILARRTFRIVRQNLAWAFGYNTIGIIVAAFGLLRPVIAAAAMVLSSVFVVANSMRLQRASE